MEVNICPRLISLYVNNGVKFVRSNGCIEREIIPIGVYATKKYTVDSLVYVLTGILNSKPSEKSIHIGNNMHIIDNIGQYIQHSTDPSVCVKGNKLYALKNINIHDEITINYNNTEIDLYRPVEDDGVVEYTL